ncbi:hypothetical protein DdX_12526 [Ditylenchus destructor]|uniref:Uncharacterized protein n=1 Tax=Ditylenchus destructor TaxID=166010 RepID=A0AAD4R097_9BILA|nr:hypothetical protein DdX_12526 [Ditylenchus destructor]
MLIFLAILPLPFLHLYGRVDALTCYGGNGAINFLTVHTCRESFKSCTKMISFKYPDRIFRACHPIEGCKYSLSEKTEQNYFVGNMICANVTEWPSVEPSEIKLQICCCNKDACNL